MIPNKDQILSVVRMLLQWFAATTAGVALFKAIGIQPDPGTLAVVAGIIAGVIAFVWSLIDKTKAATVAKAADIVPITANAQAQVGIDPNNAQTIPTNPKK